MKKLLLFSLILTCFSFLPKGKSITWKGGKQLVWSDFKARAPKASNFEALSTVGISASLDFTEKKIKITVESYFIPKESWTKDQKSTYLLNHEQKHFDIAEIHARMLRKAFMDVRWNARSANKVFSKLLQECTAAENKMQERYDRESKHSTNQKNQEDWDSFIAKELKKYNSYYKTDLDIKR